MQVINMTGETVVVFTVDGKGRKTLDVFIPHGEDKRISGYTPYSPSVLSCHKNEDDARHNKFQVLPGRPCVYGNKDRRIVIRNYKDPRPEMA